MSTLSYDLPHDIGVPVNGQPVLGHDLYVYPGSDQ